MPADCLLQKKIFLVVVDLQNIKFHFSLLTFTLIFKIKKSFHYV